ncbi:hypothetical protein LTR17_004496 [Elasticomyces elasticus]|nr:hypothetical protein LTR17_004496 [Elasticomyces elasticus]
MTLQATRTPILTGRDDSLAIALRRNEHPSALLALPAELLCLVATCMPASSFGELRLTCREMAAKTAHAFEEHLLHTRWRVSEDSLATLLEISRTPLGCKIRHLRFSIHFLNYYSGFKKVEATKSYWATRVKEQIEFLEGDRPVALLALILSNLPKLQNLEIGVHSYHGDMVRRPGSASPITTCFRRLFTALALVQPSLVRLSVFHWDIWNTDVGVEVDRLTALAVRGPAVRGLGIAFANLTCFGICLDYKAKFNPIKNQNMTRTQWLATLVGLMPRLKLLFLAFDGIHDDLADTNHRFEGHLDATKDFFLHVHIPSLVSFELSKTVCFPPDLHHFFQKHAPTLKTVLLRRVRLSDECEEPMTWYQLFSVLRSRRTLDLSYIKLSMLYNRRGGAIAFDTRWVAYCKTCRREPSKDDRDWQFARFHHTYISVVGLLPVIPTDEEIKQGRRDQQDDQAYLRLARETHQQDFDWISSGESEVEEDEDEDDDEE